MADEPTFRSLQANIATDGRSIRLTFTMRDGQTSTMIVPFDDIADAVIHLEDSAKAALQRQEETLKGQDRRVFYPLKARRVTNLGGAYGKDGDCVLTLELNGKMQLDLGLDQSQVRELIDWLETLLSQAQAAPKKPN